MSLSQLYINLNLIIMAKKKKTETEGLYCPRCGSRMSVHGPAAKCPLCGYEEAGDV